MVLSRREAGFTLFELMIALVILIVISGALTMVFMSSKELFVYANQRGELVERSRRAIDRLESDLMMARIVSVQGDNSLAPEFTYVLPVDIGEDANGNGVLDVGEDENASGALDTADGDFYDQSANIQWGCLEAGIGRLDTPTNPHRITVRFQQTDTYDEATEGIDLNRDGDTTDTYARGFLQQTTTDGEVHRIGGDSVILAQPQFDGDRNNDGNPDPLFAIGGESFTDANGNGVVDVTETFDDTNGNNEWDPIFTVNLSFFLIDERRNPHVLQITRSVSPRNPQGD
ncbi:MAG: prepilin-type N-terminal cleavage/methylation domain-containing protein [Planctomycetota bacterium]